MTLPDAFNEKVLWHLHMQIRAIVLDPALDQDEAQLHLAGLCFAPWEIANLFGLPTTDPTSVIDRYSLRAIAHADYHMINVSHDSEDLENEPWAADISHFAFIPLFSPLDVWKALQAKEKGDDGVEPPPVECEADRLIRSIRRGYELITFEVSNLANSCHDLLVLAAALTPDDLTVPLHRTCSVDELERFADQYRLWRTSVRLEGKKARQYLDSYASTTLASVSNKLDANPRDRKTCGASWASSTIIEHIELAEEYSVAIDQPKYLFYKAVTVHKGRLPEEKHNRMLAEAMNGDRHARAYLAFIKAES